MHLKGTNINKVFPNFSFNSSVLKLLLNQLEQNGNEVAQIDADRGSSHTYADILQLSKSIAVGLTKAGVDPDDYVVICSSKSFLAFSLQLAVMFTGAIPVLIDGRAAGEVHRFTKGHVIKAIFCEKVGMDDLNESIKHMNPRPALIVPAELSDPSMQLMLQPSEEFSLFEVKDNKKKVVLVLFTSGSTSDPKGVQISDFGLQRLGCVGFISRSGGKRLLLTSSYAWISSTISLIISIFGRYCIILSEEKNPGLEMKLIEKFRANIWPINAVNISLYPKDPLLPFIDLSTLKVVGLGGAVVKRKMKDIFVSDVLKGKAGLVSVYGMTEIGVVTSWRGEELDPSKADSSGHLEAGVEIKITDDQGTLVESGNIGEIRVKSLSMTVGYWGRPDLNDKVFDSEGFFRTGDAGYFDSDGFLYLVGRASDIVTHQGTKLSVSELADLLKCHSSLLDAAVIAKRQQSNDCDLIAFIVQRPDCHVQKEEISLFATENTGRPVTFKVVHVLEAIPRTYSNKIHLGQLHNIADISDICLMFNL